MDRRTFLTATLGAIAAPALSWAATPYAPGLVRQELDSGKTVFLDFKAAWCTTCARQERVINELKAENPAYEASISFIDVDWDKYRRAEITQSLRVPRRSTLIVLRGDQELGRIVAGTSRKEIKALMDTALSAATS